MPIEIRELTIKATVNEKDREEVQASSPSTDEDDGPKKDQITDKIIEILKRKNER